MCVPMDQQALLQADMFCRLMQWDSMFWMARASSCFMAGCRWGAHTRLKSPTKANALCRTSGDGSCR